MSDGVLSNAVGVAEEYTFARPFFSDLDRVRGITLKCTFMEVADQLAKAKSPGK